MLSIKIHSGDLCFSTTILIWYLIFNCSYYHNFKRVKIRFLAHEVEGIISAYFFFWSQIGLVDGMTLEEGRVEKKKNRELCFHSKTVLLVLECLCYLCWENIPLKANINPLFFLKLYTLVPYTIQSHINS